MFGVVAQIQVDLRKARKRGYDHSDTFQILLRLSDSAKPPRMSLE